MVIIISCKLQPSQIMSGSKSNPKSQSHTHSSVIRFHVLDWDWKRTGGGHQGERRGRGVGDGESSHLGMRVGSSTLEMQNGGAGGLEG